ADLATQVFGACVSGDSYDLARPSCVTLFRSNAHPNRVASVEEPPRECFIDHAYFWRVEVIALEDFASCENAYSESREVTGAHRVAVGFAIVVPLWCVAFALDFQRGVPTAEYAVYGEARRPYSGDLLELTAEVTSKPIQPV